MQMGEDSKVVARPYRVTVGDPETGNQEVSVVDLTDEQVATLTAAGATLNARKDAN